MKALLRNFLAQDCKKHIARHYEYLYELQEQTNRKYKRTGVVVNKVVHRPDYWSLDVRFNPFKVQSPRKLNLYSHTLAKKVRAGTYKPSRALRKCIPKEDGTQRELNIFQLPDAALSNLVYKSLLKKNLNRFSAYSYAYREDKGPHDAIFAISSDWHNLDRVYVAEFDFSKFFDNINHDYLWGVLKKQRFLYTPEEKIVLSSFLESESAEENDYKSGPRVERTKGIPQGTSISLFLANVACWELDSALERLGVAFCRYADDTLIWSESYSKVVQAYDAIRHFAELMDVPINLEKSKGISLITKESNGEINPKESVDYLGYKVSTQTVSMMDRRISKVKQKLGYIVYQNLLQPLKQGIYNSKRLSTVDWDYIVALSQIRRYLYGGLNDEKLRKYIRGQLTSLNFRGLMSFYPLINDNKQLSKLDGWLIYILTQSLKVRKRMWKARTGGNLPGPTPNWLNEIAELKYWEDGEKRVYDFRIPSFSLINKAMQLAISRAGIGAVEHPTSKYY